MSVSYVVLTYFAVDSLPPLYTLLISAYVTKIVTKLVISRPTKLCAGGVVVVTVTLHPHPVCQTSPWPSMVQRMPFRAWIYDAGICRFFNDIVKNWKRKQSFKLIRITIFKINCSKVIFKHKNKCFVLIVRLGSFGVRDKLQCRKVTTSHTTNKLF